MSDVIKTTAEAIEAAALPDAYALHMDAESSPCAEQEPIPSSMLQKPIEQKSPAEWAYERIVLYIQNFEKQLDSDHEVGMGFVGGDVGTLKIQGMGYFAPDLITFYGADPMGAKMQLVQHVSQLNVMLVSADKEDKAAEPNRIGFKLAKGLNEKHADGIVK
jgi:hypothetical protein